MLGPDDAYGEPRDVTPAGSIDQNATTTPTRPSRAGTNGRAVPMSQVLYSSPNPARGPNKSVTLTPDESASAGRACLSTESVSIP